MEGPLQYSRGNMSAGMVWAGGMPSKVIFATVVTDAQMGKRSLGMSGRLRRGLRKLQQLMTGLYLWSLRVPRADGEDKVVQHQGSLEREHFKRCGNNYQVGWGLKRSIGLSPERFHWRFTECCYTFLLTLPFELIMDSQIIVCILQRGPWTIIMLPQCDILHSNNIKTWKLTWHNTMN